MNKSTVPFAAASFSLALQLASAGDITGTIVYLASDESSAVTGVSIPIDGGWCAW